MTHAERHERREQMAAAVEAGEALPAIAKRFGVSECTIKTACRERGVVLQRKRYIHDGRKVDPYLVLAKLQSPEKKTLAAIGAECGIAWQRVQQLKERAKELGLLDTGSPNGTHE